MYLLYFVVFQPLKYQHHFILLFPITGYIDKLALKMNQGLMQKT